MLNRCGLPIWAYQTQCGKKGATVWGQEAPEQLTPMFSQPCPQHTLAEGLSVSGYDLVTQISGKREAPRRLAKRAGERSRGFPEVPSGIPVLRTEEPDKPGPLQHSGNKGKNPMSLTHHLPVIPHKHTYAVSSARVTGQNCP